MRKISMRALALAGTFCLVACGPGQEWREFGMAVNNLTDVPLKATVTYQTLTPDAAPDPSADVSGDLFRSRQVGADGFVEADDVKVLGSSHVRLNVELRHDDGGDERLLFSTTSEVEAERANGWMYKVEPGTAGQLIRVVELDYEPTWMKY